MSNLKTLREGWEDVERIETELLADRSIQDKIREYIELLAEFGEWNDDVENVYQTEREEALLSLQERLARLR